MVLYKRSCIITKEKIHYIVKLTFSFFSISQFGKLNYMAWPDYLFIYSNRSNKVEKFFLSFSASDYFMLLPI